MNIRKRLEQILASANGDTRRPHLNKHRESSISGLYVVGDLAGAPVIKLAMEQGLETAEHIASFKRPREADRDVLDVVIIGAGAAGLNAALAAQDRRLSYVLLEKEKIANTIENFPEGKWVYAEPDQVPPKGKLWLDGAQKEDLIKRWHQIVRDNGLNVKIEEPVENIRKDGQIFTITTPKGQYRAFRVILASGQRGNPRKLGVPGEDQESIYHRLYSPRHYRGEDILVVGGGNSAVEAALILSEQNRVVLVHRGSAFARLFKDNADKLEAAVQAGRIETMLDARVEEFGSKEAVVRVGAAAGTNRTTVKATHSFVLIGADLPVGFLRSIGLRLENDRSGSLLRSALSALVVLLGLWFAGGQTGLAAADSPQTLAWSGAAAALLGAAALIFWGSRGDRWAWLGLSFLICYTVYGAKVGAGQEFWPFKNWGFEALSFAGRPWSFWYTVLYTILMTVFGLAALNRWGLRRKDRFQIWRFVSLLAFQWLFFFIVPEFLFQWAVKYQWVGALAQDPVFAEQAWRSYGLVYAWPLFFYTFFYNPHQFWIVWGIALTFVIIPILVLFVGKRYCSWICGCGGLAETLGDRWRHLAPKGPASIRWEWMNMAVLAAAAVITAGVLLKDVLAAISGPADTALAIYRVTADIWLVGILPVTLYPFLGGKIWCRYWCPLAKMMGLLSRFYSRRKVSRFHIYANDKCIACNECSRYCQVGIDVMSFSLKQEVLDNANSSCIGCGICVSVCPMDVLSFQDPAPVRVETGRGR